jgi:hypothetical protein
MVQQSELAGGTYAYLVLDDRRPLERTVKEMVPGIPSLRDRSGLIGFPDGPIVSYREFGGRVQVEIYQNGGNPEKARQFFDRLNGNVNKEYV